MQQSLSVTFPFLPFARLSLWLLHWQRKQKKSVGIRGVTSYSSNPTPGLDDALLQKISQEHIWFLQVCKHISPNEQISQEHIWFLQVCKHISPNEHEVSPQAW